MEDKTFELIEKLYNRMEERFNEQDTRIDRVKTELKQDITRVELNMVRMEDKFDTKLSALFDGVTTNTESINNLRVEMKALETKVETHEVKLKIVK